jgi:hypothetical protein
VWKNSGNIRFKEDFSDTLHTLSGGALLPSLIFHTGKYHWPVEEKTAKGHAADRLFIADVSETDDLLFFQCIKGMNTDDPILYNALYNKKTGATQLGKHGDGIEDDLTHFLPLTPFGIGASGEFVFLLEAADVADWINNHPESLLNEHLSPLVGLGEEGNPVVVVVR